ncbi:protein DPCD [Euwallacea fornicatus]|uniref:protein DPCD n=1 Tax=Euwallacea fornicatus TaxID=995702 RepID=UPI00338F6DAE
MTDWFTQLQKAKKTCLVDKNLKKIHFDFGDGRELVEEYDLSTALLTRRAWRFNKGFNKNEETWEIEVGDPEPNYKPNDKCMIRENSNQPFVTKSVTKSTLEWRIRNLPYSVDIYSVVVDKASYSLIVKTTNKKYYKKLPVQDLERLGIELEQKDVSFSHKFNTLIVTYNKPKKLQDVERAIFNEVKQIQPKSYQNEVNNCKPS